MNTPRDFLLGLQDPQSAGFRFASGCPVTLMATSYAVMALEFEGALTQMPPEKKSRIASFLLSALGPDGNFRDPLFREEDILSRVHDLSYFEEETTAFCLQALDALGEKMPARDMPGRWATPQALVSYLSSLPWKDPWLESNRVMFALSRLCYEAEINRRKEYLTSVDRALDWLDARQNEKTGLWHGCTEEGILAAAAATVHFTFFYVYRKRPVRFAARIVDSCLSLQASHGLFSRSTVGHTCFDYDAIQLLYTMGAWTDHRKKEITRALRRAATSTKTLQNGDGGFADAKLRIPWPGLAPIFLAKKMVSERFTNCWKHLSSLSLESNAYSTWLRSMTLVLAGDKAPAGHRFRRLPFLGYQPS